MADLLIENGSKLLDKFLGNSQDGPVYAALLVAILADQLPEDSVVSTDFSNDQGLVDKKVLQTIREQLQPVPPVQ